jgi:hypothetical protein
MLRKLQMHGEMVGLITLVQLFHMVSVKLERSQMVKLSTLIILRLQSRQLILKPKREDKIPLMPKNMPMPGELDGPQALAQSFL